MQLTIVGSGTAAPTPDRVCSGYWVDADDLKILLDCGPGVVHRMAQLGLPWYRLDHLLITHFHNDHIGDVPMLLFALEHGVRPAREKPLTLWAPAGIRDRLDAMNAAFGDHVTNPEFPLVVREIGPGEQISLGSVTAHVASTPHTDHSVAYRLEHDGATLGYTGDTGPSAELAAFMAGASVLIAECSLPDEEAMPTHLTPTTLAGLGAAADPVRLVVTHVYPQHDASSCGAALRREGWSGELVVAEDGLRIAVR